MKTARLLSAMALSAIISLLVLLALSPASVAPVWAEDDQPPRTRANAPEAFVPIYVDRADDANVTACTAAANDCTLRGAINKANGDLANIYTIYFTPTVSSVNLANPLPIITADALWVLGGNGVPKIDAIGMAAVGSVFTIQADDVWISGLSIVNVNPSPTYANIQISSGTRNLISHNYLGTLPGAQNCTPSGVSRNAAYGILIESGVNGTSSAGNGSAYIYNNTIGCNTVGILVQGADYLRIGEDNAGFAGGNAIGVSAGGITLTNGSHGIYMLSSAGNAPRYNLIANNVIAGNVGDGIFIGGNGTPNTSGAYNNVIRANRIGLNANGARRPNARGIYLTNGTFQNFIGGASNADRNIISGNASHGIWISNSVGIGVLGNYIGVGADGSSALGNQLAGVKISGGESNIVGGAIYGILPATKGNLIGYNGQDGVQLVEGTHLNAVVANNIHLNTLSGVSIFGGAYDNLVGGDVITSLNTIVGNGTFGVYLAGNTTTGNTVKYNDILNNSSDGVTLQDDTHDNEIGSANPSAFNLIRYNFGSGIWVLNSGPNTISANGIIGNQYYGVILDGSATQGTIISHTTIIENGYDGIGERNGAGANFWNHVSLYDNAGLGIDKEASSDTANIVNAPSIVIESVNRSTGVVKGRATGSLLLVLNEIELYRIDLDPSGYGEGKTYVGSTVTDANGNWQIVDPSPGSGCYTAYESLVVVVPLGSSEFSRTNCAVMLPAVLK